MLIISNPKFHAALVVIITALAFTPAKAQEGPKKFKSYVEMRREQMAKSDVEYTERQRVAQEAALLEAARLTQLKIAAEEHARKLEIANALATKIDVRNTTVVRNTAAIVTY